MRRDSSQKLSQSSDSLMSLRSEIRALRSENLLTGLTDGICSFT